jgi:hypothetical protein
LPEELYARHLKKWSRLRNAKRDLLVESVQLEKLFVGQGLVHLVGDVVGSLERARLQN